MPCMFSNFPTNATILKCMTKSDLKGGLWLPSEANYFQIKRLSSSTPSFWNGITFVAKFNFGPVNNGIWSGGK